MEIIKAFLYIIVTMAGMALLRQLFVLLNRKIDEIQARNEGEEYFQLNQYVDAAQETIESVVLQVSQTYVDVLKAAGQFTSEAQANAKAKAVELAKLLISDVAREAVSVLHGDFDTWLDIMIEKWVKYHK